MILYYSLIPFTLHFSVATQSTAQELVPCTRPEYLLFKEGIEHQRSGRRDDAIRCYTQAAKYDPSESSASIHLNLGIIYSHDGNYNHSISEFRKCLELKPGMPDALLNLGSAYQAAGELESAQQCFKDYLNLPFAQEKELVSRLLQAVSREHVANGGTTSTQDVDYFDAVARNGIAIWNIHKMPLKVYIEPGDNCIAYQESYRDALMRSFDDWSRASNGAITCRTTSNQTEADILCRWTDNASLLGDIGTEGGACTIKFLKGGQTSEINLAEIVLLTHELQNLQPVSINSMKKRCLHEVGHSLGLSGHSINNNDVMFFTQVESVGLAPSDRDISTLQRLYCFTQSSLPTHRRTMSSPKAGPLAKNARRQRKYDDSLDWRNQVRRNLRHDNDSGFFSE